MVQSHWIQGLTSVLLVSVAVGCGAEHQPEATPVAEAVLSHENCSGAGAFLPVNMAVLGEGLPDDFAPRDASFLGPEFAGMGSWAVAGWTCRESSSAGPHSFAVIVSLIDPPVTEDEFPDVGLHWYEHVRFIDEDELYNTWHDFGLNVRRGAFPELGFSDGDSVAVLSMLSGGTEILRIETELKQAVDFPAQELLFWQATPAAMLYSKFTFGPHRSWLGGLSECVFEWNGSLGQRLATVPCPDSALVEVIEQISLTSATYRRSERGSRN
jgi:hypothetical protein